MTTPTFDPATGRRHLTATETAIAAAAAVVTFLMIIPTGLPAPARLVGAVLAAAFWLGFTARITGAEIIVKLPKPDTGARLLTDAGVLHPVRLVCATPWCAMPFVLDLTDQHVGAVCCEHMAQYVGSRAEISSLTRDAGDETATLVLQWPGRPNGRTKMSAVYRASLTDIEAPTAAA
ncbi:hypothetical protein [Dactylosporangium sp. CS-033363]|uniref:hypothetical protein n=1 Tax=Dactylosporangium sp. CS-033363 TaxID=3239935 RepID=UPI003D915037